MGSFVQQRDFIRRLLYFLDENDLNVLANVNTVFKQLVDEYRHAPIGRVYMCGNGGDGRLGDGRTDNHYVGVPTQVPNLQGVAQVSCGDYHTAFVGRLDPNYRIGACLECDAPAKFVCARCVDAVYCSAECQQAHWRAHSLKCV
jgi:hypothetical protein